jgi:hypothetical protein
MLGAACAGALGGGSPLERDAIALKVGSNTSSEELGARLQQGGYEFALISADRDSAWLAAAATRAGLQMTRPGRVGPSTYVFFGPKPVGDTTHTVPVQGGGQVQLHDALYRVDKDHAVDLILARFDAVTDLSRGVRALLGYVGNDVSNNAALLLAIESPTPQAGDSIALLLRAAYTDTRECAGATAPATSSAIRLFYGPQVRVKCERAEVLNESGGPVSAQFLLP